MFKAYAKLDANAINTSAPVLTYEGFLSALIDVAFRVKRMDQPYLSEAVREYVLTYVSRACKMSPSGLRRGQMRDALEGTKDGPPPTPGGAIASKSVTKQKKKATIAVSTGLKVREGPGCPCRRPGPGIGYSVVANSDRHALRLPSVARTTKSRARS